MRFLKQPEMVARAIKGDTHVTKNSSIVSGLGILAFALIGFWSPFSVEIECHWYMAPNTRA